MFPSQLSSWPDTFEWCIVVYLFTINTTYFGLILVGFFELLRSRFLNDEEDEYAAIANSSLTPPISVVAPAFNEAATVVESVRAMLSLAYPEFEVIVVNDGSKDDTLKLLTENFHLFHSARFYESTLQTKQVRAVYESMDGTPLVVIDKENGGKADALNAGINVARYPLFCAVDSDSLLERDALLRLARPLVGNPSEVIAVGGIVRVANGCSVDRGRVMDVGLPQGWIARFQVVEYLRAFLGGRVALSSLNCLLVISGAFGLFSRSAVLAAGGYSCSTVGEDMELVVRLHRWARRNRRKYQIVFEPNPVCWTEVPESLAVLKRQRNRWQRGTVESLWTHREMFGRVAFGAPGLFALPFFVAFEMLGPLVEVAGYALTLAGLALGWFELSVASLFFAVSTLYGVLLSISSLLLAEVSGRRYPRVRDLMALAGAAVLENFGFRQLLTIWRAQAFIDLWRRKTHWGVMERKGFQSTKAQGEPPDRTSCGKGTTNRGHSES